MNSSELNHNNLNFSSKPLKNAWKGPEKDLKWVKMEKWMSRNVQKCPEMERIMKIDNLFRFSISEWIKYR